jgi:hypothetical protein
MDVRGWTGNDTTYFIPLVERAAENIRGRELAADIVYLSRKNLNAVETASAMPFIPFKTNSLEPTEVCTNVPPVHAQTR